MKPQLWQVAAQSEPGGPRLMLIALQTSNSSDLSLAPICETLPSQGVPAGGAAAAAGIAALWHVSPQRVTFCGKHHLHSLNDSVLW